MNIDYIEYIFLLSILEHLLQYLFFHKQLFHAGMYHLPFH